MTEVGAEVPEALTASPTKLRRFWESRVIELRDFEPPNVITGQPEKPKEQEPLDLELELPEGVSVERGKGSWFLVTDQDGDEHKANGKKALDELLEAIKDAAADASEDDDQDDQDASDEEEGQDDDQDAEGFEEVDDDAGSEDAEASEVADDAEPDEDDWLDGDATSEDEDASDDEDLQQ